MAYYIKVTEKVADEMGLRLIRNKTADGNYLLWQADLNGVSGRSIFDRAAAVGGVCLLPQDARMEIEGSKVTPLPSSESEVSEQTEVEQTENAEES